MILMRSTIKNLKEIIAPVNADLNELDNRILNEISPASRALSSIIQEIFKAGGKRVRPALSFLVFRALTIGENISADIEEKIFLVAEISELIHTASLVHDDIIDNSLIRRGRETANSKWDNAVTVISGDFMFARAAVNLGKVGINEITCIYAKVLEDLCDGEIRQVEKKFSTETDWDYYYSKTYKKTASLFEAATKSPAIIVGSNPDLIEATANYGKDLGLAFQIIDDILDFTADEKTLGKPAFADLKDGQITMPVLYTLEHFQTSDQNKYTKLCSMIEKLSCSEDPDEKNILAKEVYTLMQEANAIEKSFARAKEYINSASMALTSLPNSIYKQALIELAEFIINRNN